MLSSVTLFILTFAILGLLLGIAEYFDTSRHLPTLPENIEDRDPAIQQKFFEQCIKDQRLDGELTHEEYDRCAYSIYG
jgi:hypothetical protein